MVTPQLETALWEFEREGRRYGPVLTPTIESLCRAGVIVPSSGVHSTLFDRWVLAATVPAMRAWLVTAPATPQTAAEMLCNIPSMAIRRGLFDGDSTSILALVMAAVFVVTGIGYGIREVSHPHRTTMAPAPSPGMTSLKEAIAKLQKLGPSTPTPAPILAHSPVPATSQPAFKEPPGVSQDQSPIAQMSRQVLREQLDSRMRYEAALRNAHIDRILVAQNLANPQTYPAARQSCASAYVALENLEHEQRQIFDSIAARAKACNVSEQTRQQFLAGFNSTRPQGEKFLAQEIVLQHQQIDEFVEILNLIAPYAGRVVAVDGKLRFPRQDLADAYNDHIRRLQFLTASQKQMEAQHLKQASKQMEGMATVTD